MTPDSKAKQFHSLHTSAKPLVLYNIWDAGSAKAVTGAGASAIATGSASVAAAQGYEDGESLPLEFALQIYARIIASTPLPVTIDFESGYASAPEKVAENAAKIIMLGAAGINFEDQIMGGEDLHEINAQCSRLQAIRTKAEALASPLFINARTDLFLKAPNDTDHPALLAAAIDRAIAYADAGASGFFAPGLRAPALIKDLCAACPIPVNIMMMEGVPSIEKLGRLGVARVSFGPGPFVNLMNSLRQQAGMELPD